MPDADPVNRNRRGVRKNPRGRALCGGVKSHFRAAPAAPSTVDVFESMEESPLAFAVAAAYIPIAQADLRTRVDGLIEELLHEASRLQLMPPQSLQLMR